MLILLMLVSKFLSLKNGTKIAYSKIFTKFGINFAYRLSLTFGRILRVCGFWLAACPRKQPDLPRNFVEGRRKLPGISFILQHCGETA